MRNFVTYFLLAATIAKVVAVLALGPATITWDAKGYWLLSDSVLKGDVLMMGDAIAYRTPLYPWFLATVRLIFNDFSLLAIVALQGSMQVASLWIAGKIATVVTRSSWAMPLTLLVALPTLSAVTYSATVLTESLFTFLLMLNLWSVLAYLRVPTAGRASLVGISFAITMLTRPVVIHLWLAHAVLMVWNPTENNTERTDQKLPVRMRVGHLGVAAVSIAVIISPWLVRNDRLFGTPFLTEFLGRNIWIVTFQDGSGAGLDLPATADADDLKRRLRESGSYDQWRATWIVSNALVDSGLSDPEADRLMKRVATDAIKSNPGRFAYKLVRRVANFWRCAVTDLPAQGTEHGNFQDQWHWSSGLTFVQWAIEHRMSRSVAINTLITTVIGVAVIILILQRETRPFGIWFGLIFSYFALVTGLVEIPNYRYRMVLEPLAAAAVGSAIVIIPVQRRRTDDRQRSIEPTNENG